MNQKREHIAQIEARYGLSVRVEGDLHLVSPDFSMEKFKTASRIVREATAPVVSADASLMDLVDATDEDEAEEETVQAEEETKPKRKRRRRRRKKGGNAAEQQDAGADSDAVSEEAPGSDEDGSDDAKPQEGADSRPS